MATIFVRISAAMSATMNATTVRVPPRPHVPRKPQYKIATCVLKAINAISAVTASRTPLSGALERARRTRHGAATTGGTRESATAPNIATIDRRPQATEAVVHKTTAPTGQTRI